MYKITRTFIGLALMTVLLSSCQTRQPEEPVVLKVAYPSAKQFYVNFGYAFENRYPNIDVQVIPSDPVSEETGWNREADVIYINGMEQYKTAIEKGILKPISPPFTNGSESGDLSPIVTSLLEAASDNGQYYALPPTFHSEALYYNKKLFDAYHIPYPQNGMTWEEVFALAERFPTEDDQGKSLYGIQMNYYRNVTMNFILKAGQTENLTYLDPKTMKVTMNTDKWKSIWTAAVKAFRAGAVYDQGEEADSMEHPKFLTENAAMTVSSNAFAYDFEPFSHFEGATLIDWGMVTAPVDPLNPDYMNFYEIFDFFGVSSSTEHAAEAMKLVKFIAGDPVNSQLLAKNQPNYGLPAVTEYVEPVGDHDLSPLYSLKANPNYADLYTQVDAEILDAFQDAAQGALDKLLQNEITLDEALAEVEVKGQEAVDTAVLTLEQKRKSSQGDIQ
ncbi:MULTISPECIES: extracellular solute-binding protein [Paenibacillus]|uniref:extracellular solute-binding protein n=1 Tax=Paenibacillus TaxID=44249 RepID=UPI00242F05DD|nr:extracellular solute-binding protein [Paenibacillus macerans]MBS5911044.1 extracellular solute-binding protein [Paenibacillus macerans]MDU5945684.1 extracellular solute-binding protein [Paenibacillus macerans]